MSHKNEYGGLTITFDASLAELVMKSIGGMNRRCNACDGGINDNGKNVGVIARLDGKTRYWHKNMTRLLDDMDLKRKEEADE